MRFGLSLAALLLSATVEAHPLGFGHLRLDETSRGEVRVRAKVSGTEQQGSALDVSLPAFCELLATRELSRTADERVTLSHWRCGRSLRGSRVTLRGLEGAGVQLAVELRLADGERVESLVDDRGRELTIPAGAGSSPALRRYLALGVTHIAEGVDHLAFVLSLALWIRAPRALLGALTGFTLGHSATLAWSALGGLRVPQRPVEACIALSVLVVAVELASGRAPPRRPVFFGVILGALHGLGFAGALASIGLPRGQRVAALAAFNLGVELGQLLALGAFMALRGALAKLSGESHRARSLLIEALGAWSVMLLLQRVW